MPWDRYQVEEFDQHWQSTYVVLDQSLLYVNGAVDFAGKTFKGTAVAGPGTPTTRRSKTYPMELINPDVIPSGFYTNRERLNLFTCVPATTAKKGVCSNNAMFGYIQLTAAAGLDVRPYGGVPEEVLVDAFKEHKKIVQGNPTIFAERLALFRDQSTTGFALGRNYAAQLGVTRRGNYRYNVVSLGGPIGTISMEGVVRLNPIVDYLKDGLFSEVKESYGKEIEINVTN